MQTSTTKSLKNSTLESYRAQRLKTPGHKSSSNINALKDIQELEQLALSRHNALTSRNQEEPQSQSLTERKQVGMFCEEYGGGMGASVPHGRQSDMEQFKVNFRLPLDQLSGINSQTASSVTQDESKSGIKNSNFKMKALAANRKPDIPKKPSDNNNIINRLVKTKSTNIKHKDSKTDRTANDKFASLNRNRLSKYLQQIQKLHSELIPSNMLSEPAVVDSLFKQLVEVMTQEMLK